MRMGGPSYLARTSLSTALNGDCYTREKITGESKAATVTMDPVTQWLSTAVYHERNARKSRLGGRLPFPSSSVGRSRLRPPIVLASLIHTPQ